MTLDFEIMEKLKIYEDKFIQEIEENDISILRDIDFNQEDYDELKSLFKNLIKMKNVKMLKKKFPLALSMFIVWCVIKHYKDGEIWKPIFKELNVKYSPAKTSIFGDIFLDTIEKHKLLNVRDYGVKKYLSPILMHGYISNSYSVKFFDRLNRIYEIILDREIDLGKIDELWDTMFPDDTSLTTYKQVESALSLEIEKIDKQLKELNSKGYDLNFSRIDMELLEVEVNDIKEQIMQLEIDRVNTKDEIEILYQIHGMTDEILLRSYKIGTYTTDTTAIDISQYIYKSFDSLLSIIKESIPEKEAELQRIKNNILKSNNELKINNGKLVENKKKIAILGGGNLKNGWDALNEYTELIELLSLKQAELKRISKSLELNDNSGHTSFSHIYTASLFHLRESDPVIFKSFIIENLKMMDRYFRYKTIDMDNTLADQFLKWYRSPKIKNENVNESTNRISEVTEKPTSIADAKSFRTRTQKLMRMDKLTEPYLQLEPDKRSLSMVVPEHVFDISYKVDVSPSIDIKYMDGTKEHIILQDRYRREETIIYEERIIVNKAIANLEFCWINIRNHFEYRFDSILIFDQVGNKKEHNLLENGLYYLLISDSWDITNGEIINRYDSSIEGYWVIEAELNETSLVFKNRITEEDFVVRGSKYNNIDVLDLNLVEGVSLDGLEVINGKLPKLAYNNNIIDHDNLLLKIEVDGTTILSKSLVNCCEQDDIRENVFLVDLNSFVKSKYGYPVKIDIIIIGKENTRVVHLQYSWLTNTTLKYSGNNIVLKYPKGARVKHPNVSISNYKAYIPIEKYPYEEIEVYYDKCGIKVFKVEVPRLTLKIADSDGNNIELGEEILKEELNDLKRYQLIVESTSEITRYIKIFNSDDTLDLSIPLKKGTIRIDIDTIIDFLCTEDEDTLSIRWVGLSSHGNSIDILKVFKEWNVQDIEIYQEEVEDEYILEISYKENFRFSGNKYIRFINEDKDIFVKEIKEDNPYYYIKRDSIKSKNIKIEIYRLNENVRKSRLFGSSSHKMHLAGDKDIMLISRLEEVMKLKKYGIRLKSFSYDGDLYNLEVPLVLDGIEKSKPLNYSDEPVYKGRVKSSISESDVLFYLDIENRQIPLLLDTFRDGAQYDLETGEVFWDLRESRNVIAPIEDFDYEIREE